MVAEKPKAGGARAKAPGRQGAAKARKTPGAGPSRRAVKQDPVTQTLGAQTPDMAAPAAAPVAGGTLRKKELLERVVAASGARKKDARDVVEAVLKVLGEALHAGEILALPPFGKARVNRQKDTAGGETLVVKLRRTNGVKPVKETLAEPTE